MKKLNSKCEKLFRSQRKLIFYRDFENLLNSIIFAQYINDELKKLQKQKRN